jgi:uncharacterized protein (DUF433 family)
MIFGSEDLGVAVRKARGELRFTPSEAAYLATASLCALDRRRTPDAALKLAAATGGVRVSLSAVNKAIEERIIRVERRATRPYRIPRRLLSADAVCYLALAESVSLALPKDVKRRIRIWLMEAWRSADKTGDFMVDDVVAVRAAPIVEAARRVTAHYGAAREDYIVADPAVMGGAPVIKGTRIPAHSVLARIGDGDALSDIAKENPDIAPAAFAAALAFAAANPRRGRPAKHSDA